MKAPPPASLHILLVEDRDEDAELVTRELQRAEITCRARRVDTREGYTVLEAPDGRAAITMIDGGASPRIDLVLTDVVMPGMSGRALADRLSTRCPGVRVLFMSGYTDDAIVRHGMLEPELALSPEAVSAGSAAPEGAVGPEPPRLTTPKISRKHR